MSNNIPSHLTEAMEEYQNQLVQYYQGKLRDMNEKGIFSPEVNEVRIQNKLRSALSKVDRTKLERIRERQLKRKEEEVSNRQEIRQRLTDPLGFLIHRAQNPTKNPVALFKPTKQNLDLSRDKSTDLIRKATLRVRKERMGENFEEVILSLLSDAFVPSTLPSKNPFITEEIELVPLQLKIIDKLQNIPNRDRIARQDDAKRPDELRKELNRRSISPSKLIIKNHPSTIAQHLREQVAADKISKLERTSAQTEISLLEKSLVKSRANKKPKKETKVEATVTNELTLDDSRDNICISIPPESKLYDPAHIDDDYVEGYRIDEAQPTKKRRKVKLDDLTEKLTEELDEHMKEVCSSIEKNVLHLCKCFDQAQGMITTSDMKEDRRVQRAMDDLLVALKNSPNLTTDYFKKTWLKGAETLFLWVFEIDCPFVVSNENHLTLLAKYYVGLYAQVSNDSRIQQIVKRHLLDNIEKSKNYHESYILTQNKRLLYIIVNYLRCHDDSIRFFFNNIVNLEEKRIEDKQSKKREVLYRSMEQFHPKNIRERNIIDKRGLRDFTDHLKTSEWKKILDDSSVRTPREDIPKSLEDTTRVTSKEFTRGYFEKLRSKSSAYREYDDQRRKSLSNRTSSSALELRDDRKLNIEKVDESDHLIHYIRPLSQTNLHFKKSHFTQGKATDIRKSQVVKKKERRNSRESTKEIVRANKKTLTELESVFDDLIIPAEYRIQLLNKYSSENNLVDSKRLSEVFNAWKNASVAISNRERALMELTDLDVEVSQVVRNDGSNPIRMDEKRNILFKQFCKYGKQCEEVARFLRRKFGDTLVYQNQEYLEKMKKDYSGILSSI